MRCKSCGKDKDKTLLKKYREKSGKIRCIYVDSSGGRWNGKECPSCNVDSGFKKRRELGLPSMDDVRAPHRVKGRLAEHYVAEYYRSLGYQVKITRGRGPDLRVEKEDEFPLLVEVKTAVKYAGKDCWFTGVFHEAAQDAHLVAIVLPSGRIHLCTALEHALGCDASTKRYITHIVRSDDGVSPPEKLRRDPRFSRLAQCKF